MDRDSPTPHPNPHVHTHAKTSRTHIKDHDVHVRVLRIIETLKNQACPVGDPVAAGFPWKGLPNFPRQITPRNNKVVRKIRAKNSPLTKPMVAPAAFFPSSLAISAGMAPPVLRPTVSKTDDFFF